MGNPGEPVGKGLYIGHGPILDHPSNRHFYLGYTNNGIIGLTFC